jgi:hypothetical protein
VAALAHLGVGLAAKRIAPEIPVGYLVLGAYALDFVWCAFWLAGIEQYPKPGGMAPPVWSHSLFMAAVWSGLAALIAARIGRSTRTGVVFGLVVFSHWVLDFITHPMTAVYPPAKKDLPLWFHGSPLVGLGLYSTKFGVYAGEFGPLGLGIIIYILARRRLKQQRRARAAPA